MSLHRLVLEEARARFEPGSAEARRLFHGRGRTFPGLEQVTVDWYPPVALITLHSETDGELIDSLCDGFAHMLGDEMGCLLLQRRYLPGTPFETITGELPERPVAREAGLTFRLRFEATQNIGFFPDMRRGRELVRTLANGARVLNLFAYTCAFSVAALAGGADHVVNLDMSRWALALGRENHRDNGQELRRVSFLAHDLFKSFGKVKKLGPFDLIILDPPTDQGASFKAERDWAKMVRRLPQWLSPDGHVVACLNAPHLPPEFLEEIFASEFEGAVLVERLDAGGDFPDVEEERGLNILHYKWEVGG